MKKYLIGLGASLAIASSVFAVISCSNETPSKTPLPKEDYFKPATREYQESTDKDSTQMSFTSIVDVPKVKNIDSSLVKYLLDNISAEDDFFTRSLAIGVSLRTPKEMQLAILRDRIPNIADRTKIDELREIYPYLIFAISNDRHSVTLSVTARPGATIQGDASNTTKKYTVSETLNSSNAGEIKTIDGDAILRMLVATEGQQIMYTITKRDPLEWTLKSLGTLNDADSTTFWGWVKNTYRNTLSDGDKAKLDEAIPHLEVSLSKDNDGISYHIRITIEEGFVSSNGQTEFSQHGYL